MIIAQSPSGFQDSAFQTHMDHSYLIRRVQGEQQDGPMQDACLRLGSTPEGLHNTLGARATIPRAFLKIMSVQLAMWRTVVRGMGPACKRGPQGRVCQKCVVSRWWWCVLVGGGVY